MDVPDFLPEWISEETQSPISRLELAPEHLEALKLVARTTGLDSEVEVIAAILDQLAFDDQFRDRVTEGIITG